MWADFPRNKHLKQAIYRGPGGAGDATGDATNASALALAAKEAAEAAATSAASAATAAGNSATAASGSASTASTQASNAATSASSAASSATAASSSATSASSSASTATTQATNASNSASAASTSATNAASSASSASTSATNASNSASTASTQATNASNSASAASTSATNAANSATAAAASATEAANTLSSTVKLTGDQTIAGVKTFSSTIVGSINGNATITGGTVNGTSVGSSTPSTGAFTTLSASGNVTLGDASTDTLIVGNGGIVKDASGNVGINVIPSSWYSSGNLQVGSYAALYTNSSLGAVELTSNTYRSASSTWNYVAANYASRYQQYDGAHRWYTAASGSVGGAVSWSESMRSDSSGNLLVGTTSVVNNGVGLCVQGIQANGGAGVVTAYNSASASADNSPPLVVMKAMTTTTSAARFVQFYANGTTTPMGGIVGNGASNVQFASISDAREKTNIQSITGSLAKISALRPVEFDWIADGSHVPAGFVAQEVETVFPEFIVENMANDGQEERKGLTGGMTGGIIAHLVKAIQEQQALITTLTERTTALEAK